VAKKDPKASQLRAVIIMNIKITIERLKFERPKENPKNMKLELNLSWSIEYKRIDDNSLNYTCKLKTDNEFPISFTVEGTIEFENGITTISDDISQCILDNMAQILINMVNLTRDRDIDLKDFPQVTVSAQKIAS
jgi:hypothetical protein